MTPLALLLPVLQQAPPRPVAVVTRTEAPPRIDGRLDEGAWQPARSIGPLTQAEPVAGAPAREETDIRFLYDARALYVGIRCFDREPARIVATQRVRDADLEPDDRVEIVFDTFRDRRNAFFFQISPGGSIGDALISNNGADFNKPWDGIWEGRAVIDDQGWSAELAIPFQTLSFDPALDTWGFNVSRIVKRRNETDRWAGARLDVRVFHVSESGDLTGLSGMQQGIGLDVVPFFVGQRTRERDGLPDTDLTGQGGFDAFWRLTPGLTLALTVNTDFAETEVDERRVNLTRFPLFFPEKRDFFLENAGIFGFADLGRGFAGGPPALVPFFSRRIGLDENGNEVPILAGLKLTGRAGGWNLGLLDVVTGEEGGLERENLFVARASHNVGELSSVGGIVTHGDPAGDPDALLYGLDWNFRTSTFRGDKVLTANAWALRTQTGGAAGEDHALGAAVGFPNDLWSWSASFKHIGTDFDPKLGFVPRAGIRSWFATFTWSPRPGTEIRRLQFGADATVVTDLDERVLTIDSGLWLLGIEWESGDELRLFALPRYERLDDPFEIQAGVVIPPDEYGFVRGLVEFESGLKRPLSGRLSIEGGEFFDGTRTDVRTGLSWRPSALFNGGVEHEVNRVELPAGDFTTHVGRVRATWAFTPEVTWSNFVQFDNESDSAGLNSRLRWIVKPGTEVFLVWNQVQERVGDSLVPRFQEAAFKIGYTLRF